MMLDAQWFLAWTMVKGVGPVTIKSWADSLSPPVPPPNMLERAGQMIAFERPICYSDEAYPASLRHLHDPPPVLWTRGHLPQRPMLAIIGTRQPTEVARAAARWSARRAADRGWSVVSGGARGIDVEAHRSVPASVCVLGTGLDVPYPAEHASVLDEIVESGGCLVSEYPPGTDVHAGRLIARDRIIAALASAVLPVQANAESGTLHTVTRARRIERPIGVWDAAWIGALNDIPATRVRRSTFDEWLECILVENP